MMASRIWSMRMKCSGMVMTMGRTTQLTASQAAKQVEPLEGMEASRVVVFKLAGGEDYDRGDPATVGT